MGETNMNTPPHPFHPRVAKLVDSGAITLVNSYIVIRLESDDQLMFMHEAQRFSQKQLTIVVNRWLKLTDDRRKVMRQILEDIFDAFEGWDDWTGSKGSVEEQNEHEQMVSDARDRVLRFVHKLHRRDE